MVWIKQLAVSLLLLSLLFVVGCEGFDLSRVSDEDLGRIANQAIVCEVPYMRFEAGCCLDQDANGICDTDEGISEEGAERPSSVSRTATDDSIVPQRPQGPAATTGTTSTTGARAGRSVSDTPTPTLPEDSEDGTSTTTANNTSGNPNNISDNPDVNDNPVPNEQASSRGVNYRLFAADRAKIGYHLQFYGSTGVVAAFGIKEVVDSGKLVVELTGAEYNDAAREAQLGDTISLLADDGTTYSITIDDIYSGEGNSYVDVAVTSSIGKVQNRLFAADRAKMGYHLQFYGSTGVVAAFGIKEVVDSGKLVVELSGAEHNDAFREAQLGDKISLLADDGTTYSIHIDEIVYFSGNSYVDVAVSEN